MCYRPAHQKRMHHSKFKHCGPKGRRGKWSKWPGFASAWGYPPANVQEFDDRYELMLYAPGLEKSDFKISVVNNVLSIGVDKKDNNSEANFNWKRKEFSATGFKRQFELDNKIDNKKITAKYEAGILYLSFPKLKEHFTKRQDIDIV